MQNRDQMEGPLFLLFECAIFAAPVCAWLLRKQQQRWTVGQRWIFAAVAFFFILGSAITVLSKWSFRGIIADGILLVVAYFAYCALVISLSIYPPRWLTYPLCVLGTLPMLIALFLGTVGMMGAFMILGSMVPTREGKLPNGMVYRITYNGGATEEHDESVISILNSPRLLPFLEKEVFSKGYIDTDCDLDLVSARISPDGRSVEVTCGSGVMDSLSYSK